jgi:hypothetical protein
MPPIAKAQPHTPEPGQTWRVVIRDEVFDHTVEQVHFGGMVEGRVRHRYLGGTRILDENDFLMSESDWKEKVWAKGQRVEVRPAGRASSSSRTRTKS